MPPPCVQHFRTHITSSPPLDEEFRCCGYAKSTATQACRNRILEANRWHVVLGLERLFDEPLSGNELDEELIRLAELALCKQWHRDQTYHLAAYWKAAFFAERRPAVIAARGQTPSDASVSAATSQQSSGTASRPAQTASSASVNAPRAHGPNPVVSRAHEAPRYTTTAAPSSVPTASPANTGLITPPATPPRARPAPVSNQATPAQPPVEAIIPPVAVAPLPVVFGQGSQASLSSASSATSSTETTSSTSAAAVLPPTLAPSTVVNAGTASPTQAQVASTALLPAIQTIIQNEILEQDGNTEPVDDLEPANIPLPVGDLDSTSDYESMEDDDSSSNYVPTGDDESGENDELEEDYESEDEYESEEDEEDSDELEPAGVPEQTAQATAPLTPPLISTAPSTAPIQAIAAPPAPLICTHTAQRRRLPAIDPSCPICHDTLHNTEPMVWCKNSCGQNIHLECFDAWMAYRAESNDESPLLCCYCRGLWSTVACPCDGMPPQVEERVPELWVEDLLGRCWVTRYEGETMPVMHVVDLPGWSWVSRWAEHFYGRDARL